MRSALKLLPLLIFTAVIGFRLGKGGEISVEPAAEAASPALNACGCYRDSAGSCYCGKKGGKCVCPGECEPQGCEEKRAKEIQKEVDAEAKRARDAEKKQEDEQAAKAEKERKAALPPDDQADDSDAADVADKKQETAKAGKDDDDDDDTDKAPRKKFRKKSAKFAKAKGSEG
jgi:hypothetical protein